MSATKRGKQKQPAEVAEEEDFETFVRESLGQLSKGQKQIIQDISNLKAKVTLNETALGKISSQFKTLNDSFEELKGELHDARCKVDEMESSVQKHAKQIEEFVKDCCPLSGILENTTSVSTTFQNLLTRIVSKKSVTFYPISLIWSRRLKTRIVLVLEITTNRE